MNESNLVSFADAAAEGNRDATMVLPAELLVYVFACLSALQVPREKPRCFWTLTYRRLNTRLSWIIVSHVNKRWRTIVLNNPSLWTRLYLDMGKAWDAFVERSKSAPLSIEGSVNTPRAVSRMSSLFEHRRRIRALHLDHLSPVDVLNLLAPPCGAIMELTTLAIECDSIQDHPLPGLPPNFFLNSTATLRTARLVGIDFPRGTSSTTYQWSALTHFIYEVRSSSSRTTHSNVSLCDILGNISRMPCLQTLELKLLPHNIPAGGVMNVNTVSLPHLEELVLDAHHDVCWEIWSRLRIPSRVRVDLCTEGLETAEGLVTSLIDAYFSGSNTSNFMEIDVAYYRDDDLSESMTLCFQVEDTENAFLALNVDFIQPQTSPVRCIMERIPSNTIHGLTLYATERDSHTLRRCFTPLRAVTRVKFNGDVMAICEALSPQSARFDINTTEDLEPLGAILFPALKELHLSGDAFDLDTWDGPDISTHCAALSDVLESRFNILGTKLQKLTFTACSSWKAHAHLWRPFVEEITTDTEDVDDNGGI